MTAEDRLRSRLRSAASGMPVGQGSVTGVQARAAVLQRRRNAMRGGAGAFALVAVALVGIVSLRNSGPGEFSDSAVATGQQEAADAMPATTAAIPESAVAGEMAAEESAEEEMADDADDAFVTLAQASDDGSEQVQQESLEDAATGVTAPPLSETVEPAVGGASENWTSAQPDGGSATAAVFATTVSVVKPPDEAEGDSMRYSFSGGHAVAQASDGWYAYDGTDWQSLGVPANVEVVAVDLSGAERLAILGVVQPLDCAVKHVVGVHTSDGWRFARIDDGTPPSVHSELLDARVRVTHAAIEVERTELLSLWEECSDGSEQAAPPAETAGLLEDLELLGEVTRQSWLSVPLEPDFAGHWLRIAHDDAHAAALRESELDWMHAVAPRLTVPAVKLERPAEREGDDVRVALHETTILDVVTKVEVADGTAWLHHGDQSWEVCPIPDVDLAHGEIGWAGEHLAVIVGTPEQQLYLLERTE